MRPLTETEIELLTAIISNRGDKIREADPYVYPLLCNALMSGQIEVWSQGTRSACIAHYTHHTYGGLISRTRRNGDYCLAACYSMLKQLKEQRDTSYPLAWQQLREP